jgi:hypothetical protein
MLSVLYQLVLSLAVFVLMGKAHKNTHWLCNHNTHTPEKAIIIMYVHSNITAKDEQEHTMRMSYDVICDSENDIW